MKKSLLILVVLSSVLAACSFDIATDLYMQDVMDAQELGEPVYLNATLALEYSGDEEDKQEVLDILQEQLYQIDNIREEEKSYSTYLVVDYKIPLVPATELDGIYNHAEVQRNIFAFAVVSDTLYIACNKARFDELDASLYEQFYQHLDFEDFTMSLILQNDLRETIEITLYSAYADGVPVPYSDTLTLERRDDIEIRFSDVLRDSVTTPQETEQTGIAVRKFADIKILAE